MARLAHRAVLAVTIPQGRAVTLGRSEMSSALSLPQFPHLKNESISLSQFPYLENETHSVSLSSVSLSVSVSVCMCASVPHVENETKILVPLS